MQRGLSSVREPKPHRDSVGQMVSVKGQNSRTLVYKMPKYRFRQRLISVLAGSVSVGMSVQVAVQMFQSSYGIERLVHTYTLDDSAAMREWIGTTTVRQSPLVESALEGRTDPLNHTLYLGINGRKSHQQCEQLGIGQQDIYSDHWQRLFFSQVVAGSAYNFTFLGNIQLIAPVVDCSSALIANNDSTRGKFYFVIRSRADLQDVYLLTMSMAIQEFWIPSQTQVGSAAIACLTLINDLQSDHVDHHFVASLGYPFYSLNFSACELLENGERDSLLLLRTVPRNQYRELAQDIQTSYRSGFYFTSKSGRYNIRQQTWQLEDSPLNAITTWKWKSKNTSRNFWSWVHLFEPMTAIYTVGHITIQLLITYQALTEDMLWTVDGSVSMAKPLMLRGLIVVLFWCLTSFWELTEFCLRDAHEILGINQIFSFTESMRFDILFIGATWASFLAYATKDRIDGGQAFAITLFVFSIRMQIIGLFPSLVAYIKELTIEFDHLELKSSSLSPMQLRAPYAIHQYPIKLMVFVLSPLAMIFMLILLLVITRKISRYFQPRKMIVIQQSYTPTNKSHSFSQGQPVVKSAFTNFELATGSQLETMYGILADFENIIIIKGMKFASADGVFGAGFVIVNKKYLVQTNDIWHILLMKLIRVRYINVYVFLLHDTTVRQTALLAYPETITMRDLLHLSVTTLS